MNRWLLVPGLVVCGALVVRAQQTAPAPAQGIYTEAQARRGQVFYQDFCEACHGPALAGDTAAPLVGPKFEELWIGKTYRDLFEKIRVTMPPDAPGTITRPQIAAIIAYKLSLDRFPAGQTDLTTDAAVLRTIPIAPARP
jgi:S-disulfanyl-L-cysteine oxidoreductase SoxD